ncbi:hypothetical protein AALA83_15090 [Oscillospiraceae bacterium 44-5]
MKNSTFYTAVGHFRCKTDENGHSYPVILVNQEEYLVDIQEMSLWTILSWRLFSFRQAEEEYNWFTGAWLTSPVRTFEACLKRLEVRGLVASGSGSTDFEVLYDLLGGLNVVPLSESLPLRLATFLKLIFKGTPFSAARELFQRDRPSPLEAQVMALSRQAALSTAELVKCAETGVEDVSSGEKIMEALYNDDYTTSDNIQWEMLQSDFRAPVTLAVANLYLRKQIILERV